MPAILAWLLAYAAKHWHAIADVSVGGVVAISWLTRWPTVAEAVLVACIIGHNFLPQAKSLTLWLWSLVASFFAEIPKP